MSDATFSQQIHRQQIMTQLVIIWYPNDGLFRYQFLAFSRFSNDFFYLLVDFSQFAHN